MAIDEAARAEKLVQHAALFRKKKGELEQLRSRLRSEFSDSPYDQLVDKLLADDQLDGSVVVETITGTKRELENKVDSAKSYLDEKLNAVKTDLAGSIWWNFVIVGFVLLIVVAIAWLAAFLLDVDLKFGTPGDLLVSLGAALFLVLTVSAAALLLIGSARSIGNFDKFWERAEKILQSGAFYFFAGFGLLLYAIHASNAKEHPSLTFLIAMLGFAIMLFGTGSQAAGAIATAGARVPRISEAGATADNPDPEETGSSENGEMQGRDAVAYAKASARKVVTAVEEGFAKPTDSEKVAALAGLAALARTVVDAVDKIKPGQHQPWVSRTGDWSPVKANAAIAGGAAVMTAIFGLGVLSYSDNIREVFADFERYEAISIDACARDGGTDLLCNPGDDFNKRLTLEDYNIRAENSQNEAIPVYENGLRINILVFRNNLRANPFVRLIANRVKDVTELYSREVDIMLPISESSSKDIQSSGGHAACISHQRGPTCRLSRLDLPTRQSRIPTSYFSLNFAPKPLNEFR